MNRKWCQSGIRENAGAEKDASEWKVGMAIVNNGPTFHKSFKLVGFSSGKPMAPIFMAYRKEISSNGNTLPEIVTSEY